ncbi:hypothetical protein KAX01_01120 [Candidatus Bathyarchaeota archaeon]|nr:hypothetical protein [Candidatus Bathyarchaeota archaeon]
MYDNYPEKHVRNQTSKFNIPFDVKEAQKSNILVNGANHTGKSRLACGLCSVLQTIDWKIVVFDNVGIWRQISDAPIFYRIRNARNYDLEQEDGFYPFPTESMIFDMSLIIPDLQRTFVNDVLERLWNAQVRNLSLWTLIVLEEAQLYMRNIRGSVAQNLLRICSAGRNHRIRVLGISVDLALIDSAFIRLTSQRYYGRLNIEENSKRRFRSYHGSDWTRIATELDLGLFIYLLRDKLKIIHVPCFQTKMRPQPYRVQIPTQQPKPNRSLRKKIGEWLK